MKELAKATTDDLPASMSAHDKEMVNDLARVQKNILRKMGSRRSEAIRKAGLSALAVAFAIATDKRAMLLGNVPTRQINHSHLHATIEGKPITRELLVKSVNAINGSIKEEYVNIPENDVLINRVVPILQL